MVTGARVLVGPGSDTLHSSVSGAFVAVGVEPHGGVLVLRASPLGASADGADASLPFLITT